MRIFRNLEQARLLGLAQGRVPAADRADQVEPPEFVLCRLRSGRVGVAQDLVVVELFDENVAVAVFIPYLGRTASLPEGDGVEGQDGQERLQGVPLDQTTEREAHDVPFVEQRCALADVRIWVLDRTPVEQQHVGRDADDHAGRLAERPDGFEQLADRRPDLRMRRRIQ